ncbi:MAG: hydroxymethylbilane synthase [Gammaproteobacteria bacterium]|nr:hydroxymethylbilane synthase [Gammaproteobacteria bacterium]NNC96785.1 hydroxymethylbilane synthase [Gammaproteobacteria bacterium]NNM14958.1 hydroxymethylbilane synthase [Gammaproteobacteria bacterium]
MQTLRIATRKSKLAIWQSEMVADRLHKEYPDLKVALVPLSTRGDEILDQSLQKVGGKGLFIKELEHAMLRGDADIAVHSMKDMPAELENEFCIAAVLQRASPFDALLTHNATEFERLPIGAILGTSSLRRSAQLLAHRPDLNIKPLRGNVQTRIKKWQQGEFDAIVLAEAGLQRLGLEDHISQVLQTDYCLPAAAQGIVGVECLKNNTKIFNLLQVLNAPESQISISAERAVNYHLGGDCKTPIAAFATVNTQEIALTALVAQADGNKILRNSQSSFISTPETPLSECIDCAKALGESVAKELLGMGADKILAELKS